MNKSRSFWDYASRTQVDVPDTFICIYLFIHLFIYIFCKIFSNTWNFAHIIHDKIMRVILWLIYEYMMDGIQKICLVTHSVLHSVRDGRNVEILVSRNPWVMIFTNGLARPGFVLRSMIPSNTWIREKSEFQGVCTYGYLRKFWTWWTWT